MQEPPVFGIIGGMGTAAGIYFQTLFFETLNKHGISGDQNYPEWYFFNASKAPDRSEAIKDMGPSPYPYLVSVMENMMGLGVSAVVVTCNTAHHFERQIYRVVPIPWVHLPRESLRFAHQSGAKVVGVMATDGTLLTHIYEKEAKAFNLRVVAPEPSSLMQARVMKAIYDPRFGIKYSGADLTDEARSILEESIDEMEVDVLITGCTELSFAFQKIALRQTWINPMAVAAETLFDLWQGNRSIESLMAVSR